MTLQEQQVLMSANGGKNIGSPPFLCHQTRIKTPFTNFHGLLYSEHMGAR